MTVTATIISSAFILAQESGPGDAGHRGVPVVMVMAVILAFTLIIMCFWTVSRYRRCPANKIMVIFGKTPNGPTRCVHGGAAFIWPVVQDYRFMDLDPFVISIDLPQAFTQDLIELSGTATLAAAISTQEGVMDIAAKRLLGLNRDEIQAQVKELISAQIRSVVSATSSTELTRDRQPFLDRAHEEVTGTLETFGLALINLTVELRPKAS
jgi:flotillin